MTSTFQSTTTPAQWTHRRDLLLTVLLFVAVILAYLPAMQGGRILDDDVHITRPELQSLTGLGRIWFDVGVTQQYYPLLHTAFWVEHHLWGENVVGYHLINVLLHASASGMLVLLMRRLNMPGGWLAAFLFALHPVCVESVAWIAEQKNNLSTVLALGAAVVYLRFDRERRALPYALALGLFALALLSKTAVVTLPATLLVIFWWRRGRLDWRRDVGPLLPWFVLGGMLSLVTLSVERRLLAKIEADFGLTLMERVLLAGRALWFYLGKLAWPARLNFFYPRWAVNQATWWQYLYPLAAIALMVTLWFLARSRRGPMAAFLCFSGMLAPVLGFVNVEWFVFSYVADHLQYLASLSLIILVAAGLAMSVVHLPAAVRRFAPAAAAIVLACLGLLTWQQSSRYRDPVTFYRTTVELNPASASAHNQLGAALAVLPGRMSEAVVQFETALRLDPGFADILENLGTALLKDPARRAEAVTHLEAARNRRPNRKSARSKLAFALTEMPGRLPDAIAEYYAVLQIDPDDPVIHDRLGVLLTKDSHRFAEAEAEFETALRLRPDFAEAQRHLGILLATMPARTSEAIVHFEAALRNLPDSAELHFDFGNLLDRIPGHETEAIIQFSEAVRLRPEFPEARNNLGIALMNNPDRIPEAIPHFEAALRVRPDYADAENNLGIALAQTPGRMSEAIVHFETALRINPGFAKARDNLAQAQRLKR